MPPKNTKRKKDKKRHPVARFLWCVYDVSLAMVGCAGAMYLLPGASDEWYRIQYFTAGIYCLDKFLSELDLEVDIRIPRVVLLLPGFVGGWIGAIFAQQIVRHKTRKLGFQFCFLISIMVDVCINREQIFHEIIKFFE